ncbi:MAG: hypothetical protein CFE45_18470 [Burkholderiales bacterium PBB5]|nr:MAG: hypothetical protein CFE45_18470 [Burkholderiales bacterium PBB5]
MARSGLACGTSVAGVAGSAMLGRVSALCRRERLQAAQWLDAQIATHLRAYSLAHQREATLEAVQAQARLLPAVVDQLQALSAQMAQQGDSLNQRLLASQDHFHQQAQGSYTALAASVDQSLQHSLREGARLAGATLQPVVEATMAGLARETSAFQAQVAAVGHAVRGVEALIRWNHPQRGRVSPADFIPLAEETGQISALGTWVLRRACADVATLPGALKVAVNLSPAQFSQSDLQATVQAALRDSGLPARQLELEITESLLLGQSPAVRQTLQALSALGVRIAMDDFGTGYSSLSYLWQFPFHKLKIDRSFTQHLGDDRRVALIVRAIITLAHGLGLRVTAEGVETATQAAVLRELGCDELQGYLLGRPAPLSALAHTAAPTKAPAAVS